MTCILTYDRLSDFGLPPVTQARMADVLVPVAVGLPP